MLWPSRSLTLPFSQLMTHPSLNELELSILLLVVAAAAAEIWLLMSAEKTKSSKSRLRTSDSNEHLHAHSSDYVFRPIVPSNDLAHQRKPPSPFQTGLRYLKLLGQLKRQADPSVLDAPLFKPAVLERTPAFSTNYYAPLPPLSSHAIHKSVQVDDFDDLSYTTATNINDQTGLAYHEFFFTLLSLLVFVFILMYIQLNSRPIHCLFNRQLWYPVELSHGYRCEEATNIEIHYVEIYSKIYQLEIQKNIQAKNCFGFDILSCLPTDVSSIPKGQLIPRHDHLINACHHHTRPLHCFNRSFRIAPNEVKWQLRNDQSSDLEHCSCVKNSNHSSCFHWTVDDQCALQIPWFDYCLKQSDKRAVCRAYVKQLWILFGSGTDTIYMLVCILSTMNCLFRS